MVGRSGHRAQPVLRGVLNYPALFLFRSQVGWLWQRSLSRRSHKGYVRWDRMRRLIDRWLPPIRIYHPYPVRGHGVTT